MSRVRVAVSVTAEASARLVGEGPRRDFVELAAATAGEIVYQPAAARRRGLLAKLWGPHIRQAWSMARSSHPDDATFLDGEHLAMPYLAFAWLLRRQPARVVFLGHLLTKPWKLRLLWLVTRLRRSGTIVVHSVEQQKAAERFAGAGWGVALVPYQVDTAFWVPAPHTTGERPRILAVGSENRDYETLVRAVEGLEADVTIAAGSHWARTTAGAARLPANVEYRSEPLNFAGLRSLYQQADMVVVPLYDAPNQSGVTTILEAMSCARPVIVTASRGQRECIEGPLITANGALDLAATADRGPHLFTSMPASGVATGVYVPVCDPEALRAAITHLLEDPRQAARMGAAGRAVAERSFTTGRFAHALAELLMPQANAVARESAPLSVAAS